MRQYSMQQFPIYPLSFESHGKYCSWKKEESTSCLCQVILLSTWDFMIMIKHSHIRLFHSHMWRFGFPSSQQLRQINWHVMNRHWKSRKMPSTRRYNDAFAKISMITAQFLVLLHWIKRIKKIAFISKIMEIFVRIFFLLRWFAIYPVLSFCVPISLSCILKKFNHYMLRLIDSS